MLEGHLGDVPHTCMGMETMCMISRSCLQLFIFVPYVVNLRFSKPHLGTQSTPRFASFASNTGPPAPHASPPSGPSAARVSRCSERSLQLIEAIIDLFQDSMVALAW